ncbi:hypothetical protein GCM10025876_13780 [Demequina litorisediminis]|uniref:DUF418 domain-containing protein n=1 Tax=Demequina litorisediminis TaxID=1849022 RepID=A0ABQ6IEM3_9MICO|nr:hypothetical protein GCM10025876_13780 [Demequina litorisediminis]
MRRALVFVLTLSGLKMMGLSNTIAFSVLAAEIVFGTLAWAWIRHSLGFSFFTFLDKRATRNPAVSETKE